ncbi:MAG: invasion associated locus B family protein [Erythrobacter sp.]
MIRPLGLALLLLAQPLAARDSLGVFESWAAFRDTSPKRCYAIAKPTNASAAPDAAASIATWPDKRVRGQLHIVLSREVAEGAAVRLRVGAKDFALIAKGRNAWGADPQMDAGIVAALRAASTMSVSARSAKGAFTDRYALAGAATAMDAASIGCAARASGQTTRLPL